MDAKSMKKLLLVMNCIVLAIASCGGPLMMRLYYVKGGSRIWLSSWLQTAGWPFILIPLLFAYFRRRKIEGPETKLISVTPKVFMVAAAIGVLVGLDDYLYAYGSAKLPVSTSSLIIATQLAFTALFGFLIVKLKLTHYSINAVVLLTLGAVMLALRAKMDRPAGESAKGYVIGFVLTFLAAGLYGFIMPLVELTYAKAKQTITFTLVLEMQLIMSFFATAFCTVGMIINNDFQAISGEASAFELGEAKYYVVLVWSAIIWQLYFLGAIGVISCGSSLLQGIIIAVTLPVVQVLAVVFFHEKFEAEKGVSLFLSFWGFISYFYGEVKESKKNNNETPHDEKEMTSENLPI